MSTPQEPLSDRERGIEDYTRRTNSLLSALALVYLATWSAQSIWYYPDERWYIILGWFGIFLWALFALDLAVRFAFTDRKKSFFRTNWLDTITVLVPPFRALRVLRIFTKGGVLSKGKGVVSRGAVETSLIAVALVVWVGALMVLNAERGAVNGSIKTMGQAIWWAFETITTVGYGDYTPVTGAGRTIAVLVMFAGITIVGIVSASLAATLVKRTAGAQPPPPESTAQMLGELAEIKALVTTLQTQLNASAAASPTSEPTS